MSIRSSRASVRSFIASPERPYFWPAARAFWAGISSAVFRRLNHGVLAEPCKVISADNYITGEQLELYEGNHRDPNVVEVWADVSYPLPLREDLHFIIHAAGVASPVYYMKYPLETIESAVQGTKNLLELARKNAKLEGVPVLQLERNLRRPRRCRNPDARDLSWLCFQCRATRLLRRIQAPRRDDRNDLSATIQSTGEDRAAVQRIRAWHEARRSARHSDVHLRGAQQPRASDPWQRTADPDVLLYHRCHRRLS